MLFQCWRTFQQITLLNTLKKNPSHWIILLHTVCETESSAGDETKSTSWEMLSSALSCSIHNHTRHNQAPKVNWEKTGVHSWRPQSPLSHRILPLCPPYSFFLILPFFWPPRPNPDFLTSPSHCLFLVRSFFRPPLCRNWCFWLFLRCFRICSLVFSSERTTRPPGVFCCLTGLWKLGPRRPRPRPVIPMKQKRALLFDIKGRMESNDPNL